jgi:general stress protein 26
MITNLPISFLQEKIQELQTALFFDDSESLLKLPTHVIAGTEIDTEGQMWFVIPKPLQQLGAFNQEFHAKLDFFKKGKDFYIKVLGKASIVTDKAEMENFIATSEETAQRVKDGEVVVIKVVANSIDFFETPARVNSQTWIEKGKIQFSNLFLNAHNGLVFRENMNKSSSLVNKAQLMANKA